MALAACTGGAPASAPAAVTLDAKTTVLLILDINMTLCQPNVACTATVPAIAALLKKAREAKAAVIYTQGSSPAPILAEVAPQSGEPTTPPKRADKFTNTNLEELIKQRNATTLIITGTQANGAVLYTTFDANVRGLTVVIADDTISSAASFGTTVARYQLLNEPGFPNPDNKPLLEKSVTLSRSDLISFK